MWKVVPLCEKQLRDVNPVHVLHDGMYRLCDTYKAGGGYDKFAAIYERRTGVAGKGTQFVVQLYGCPFKCPYCYVIPDGIFGSYKEVTTEKLVDDFRFSSATVFHLMGGAPALYLNDWESIISKLRGAPFHSDMLLQEHYYDRHVIRQIAQYKNVLIAVSIKGWGDDFEKNTGVAFNAHMFYSNLDIIVDEKLPFYFTFTGMDEDHITAFKSDIGKRYWGMDILRDCFTIDIVQYEALK